jgi:uncharacterized protein (DUF4415 family)
MKDIDCICNCIYNMIPKDSSLKPTRRNSRRDKVEGKKDSSSGIPEPDDTFLSHPLVHLPKKKEAISIRLDSDVIQWFRSKGRGYQTKINHLLRAYVEAQTEPLWHRRGMSRKHR